MALLLPPLTLVLAVATLVREFPRVLIVVGLLVIAIAAVWYGLLRGDAARAMGLAAGIPALLAMAVVLVTTGDRVVAAIVIVAGLALAAAAAKFACSYRALLPSASAPTRAVLSS